MEKTLLRNGSTSIHSIRSVNPSSMGDSKNPIGPRTPGSKSSPTISYELFAPRSAQQRSRLTRIQALTSGPITTAASTNAASLSSTAQSHLETSAFLKAMVPLKSSSSQSAAENKLISDNDTIRETLQEAHKTSSHIGRILTHTSNLHSTLVQTTTLAQAISDRHEALLQHSSELSHAAERLQTESDQLTRHAEEIGLPLKHYDAVDRLGLQVGVLFKNNIVVKGLARVKVDDGQFIQVLNDIDAAVIFFAERSEFTASQLAEIGDDRRNHPDPDSAASGSVEYYRRALALQEAAMDLFKEAIVERIIQTSTHVTTALNLTRTSVGGDTLEASLIYTRFHGISSRSRHLLNIIQSRMGTIAVPIRRGQMVCPYTEFWNLCRNTYIQSRQSLLKLSVRNHLDHLKDKHGLIGMTRLASVFLMRLCTAETSMYLDFFGKDDKPKKEDAKDGSVDLHTTSTEGGNDTIENPKPSEEKKKDASTLASQVMAKDGTYYDSEFQAFLDALCNNLHRTIRRGLVSILELDTLCQIVSVLREERSLANASPTTMAAARSLGRVIVDAQERLIFCANAALSKEVVRFKATPADLDYPDKLRRCRGQQDEKKDEDALKIQMQIYGSWFPPIRSVLKVLSKIFRVVEPKVFEDIALSSVQSCAKSLKDGSAYINKKSGQLHSDLFLVKHLLILREQLSPFDIELRSVERQLDFSKAGKAVSRFLANRNRRLFSMTSENALVTLLREGVHTREASIDSKRDLEDALRSACNDFIEHTSSSLAGSVITFVEQCKSITATEGKLSSQSFMTAEYVMAVVTRTQDRLEPELGEVVTQMSLYMENSATQSILLKPVVRKIVRVFEDSTRFINECAKDGNDAWPEDKKAKVLKIIEEITITIQSASPKTYVQN